MIDFHSHLIPGVDDGAESLDQALKAARNMREQGFTRVITTPHFNASTLNDPVQFEARIAAVDEAWLELLNAAADAEPEMAFARGAEIALDEPLRVAPDERVRLAGGRFVLVEFPYFSVPPHSDKVLAQVRRLGVTPIIAHPERYTNTGRDLAELGEWKRSGAFLQLNAGSLLGAYGRSIESKAWQILELGLADYISSDYHARGDCLTGRAAALIRERKGDSQFRFLSSVNGERLVADLDPTPVPAIPPKERRWSFLGARLKRTK